MKAWLLAAVLVSSPAWADPPRELLPQDAPPAAIDFSGQRKLVVMTIAAGAVVTAVAVIIAVVARSTSSGLTFPNTLQIQPVQ